MPRHELWFERLFRRLGLGTLGGSVLIGAGGFTVLFYLGFSLGGGTSFVLSSGIAYFGPAIVLLITIMANYGSIFMAKRIDSLKEYSQTMTSGDTSVDLSRLYSTGFAFLAGTIVNSIISPIYIFATFPQSMPILARASIVIPAFYFGLYIGTFLWVWGYSLFSVYHLGKLPMTLKPFTEDRSLGLRPFGRASLLLTGVYLGIFTAMIVPQIPFGLVGTPLLVFAAGMYCIALGLFLLPLIPLRTKMVRVKLEVMSWVGPRYANAVEAIRASENGRVSEELAREVSTIDKIQKEASMIRIWPFDTGTFARLSAIVLSVVAIILARILTVSLHLG